MHPVKEESRVVRVGLSHRVAHFDYVQSSRRHSNRNVLAILGPLDATDGSTLARL